ncbi:hypothetical protein QBC41DRAFT_973 [Cercophora samala]|uniref:Uncharacterized protein n=1 Tax=Cercophora samala TaxID=330535 RepID=A0AA39ZNK1_9PEZI|nr:hypothetical protein QBC41DRAFT_973 [Cercophora samala]
MDIHSLLNHTTTTIHTTPAAVRFYLLRSSDDAHHHRRRPPEPHPRNRNPRAKELTRDEKLEIRTLRNRAGWSYRQISDSTGKTVRQVQDALAGPLTPRKKGRRRKRTRPRLEDGEGEMGRFGGLPLVMTPTGGSSVLAASSEEGGQDVGFPLSPPSSPSPSPSPSPLPKKKTNLNKEP